MRTGKTTMSVEIIANMLKKGESVFVAMIQDPTDYLKRLHEQHNIVQLNVTPHYNKQREVLGFEFKL